MRCPRRKASIADATEVAVKSLSEVEIKDFLQRDETWMLKHGKLVRSWVFKDFVEAMHFVNRVAALAEQAGHHPDIDIRYNHVELGLVSHDAGGITNRDVKMAGRISTELGD